MCQFVCTCCQCRISPAVWIEVPNFMQGGKSGTFCAFPQVSICGEVACCLIPLWVLHNSIHNISNVLSSCGMQHRQHVHSLRGQTTLTQQKALAQAWLWLRPHTDMVFDCIGDTCVCVCVCVCVCTVRSTSVPSSPARSSNSLTVATANPRKSMTLQGLSDSIHLKRVHNTHSTHYSKEKFSSHRVKCQVAERY